MNSKDNISLATVASILKYGLGGIFTGISMVLGFMYHISIRVAVIEEKLTNHIETCNVSHATLPTEPERNFVVLSRDLMLPSEIKVEEEWPKK